MKKRTLMYLLPALAFLSCSEDSITDPLSTEEQVIQKEEILTNVETAYPNEIGKIQDVYFAGQRMTVEEIDGEFIYEGDIMFSPDMLNSKPVKLVYEKGETPHQKVLEEHLEDGLIIRSFYSIDSKLPAKERVTNAISHWEAKTSLKFVERSTQPNYVHFTTGSGCASYIGMIGGKQTITLASACNTGSTIHEIGHAIGLWHEQSRVDRDRHISIKWNNIQSGREHNFETYAQNGYDGEEFTSNLDFGSIMMYGPYSFSGNGQPTITRANGSSYSVQRSSLSTGDLQGIASMYPDDEGSTTETSYINGEYYTLEGLTVLRYYNSWYYNSPYGMRAVKLVDGIWYYR